MDKSPDPNRIKRNTACTSCRDSKVKCIAAARPNEPCVRCAKLEIACVVDKSHKRTTRRSKLEQLEKEVQSIRNAVRTQTTADVAEPPSAVSAAPPLPSPRPRLMVAPDPIPVLIPSALSPPPRPFPVFPARASISAVVVPEQVPTPSHSTATAYATPTTQGKRPSEPRALGSRVFSSEDIDYYFDQFFEHCHPYFPVLRVRDPDKCYRESSFLFWVVICVASRRHSRDDSDVLNFLAEQVSREASQVLATWPLGFASLTALLLLAAWPLPSVRFLADPSAMYASVALTGCLFLGLHTGQGGHPEFRSVKWTETSDLEARHIWAGANIIAQRSFAAVGLPCTATVFNQPLDHQIRQGPPPDFLAYFEVLLEAQKFSNHVSRVMFAATEVSDYVSEQSVRMLEEEYDVVEQTLSRSQTDLDLFTLLAVRLEIQTYYFAPSPKADKGALRRNVARAYHTARTLLSLALRLEAAQGFLAYAPHHVFRTVLDATGVVVVTGHSVYCPDNLATSGAVDDDVQTGLRAMRACVVQEGDLASRASKMLESYWGLRHLLPAVGTGLSNYRRRVGAVVVFDALKRWKTALEEFRNEKMGGQHAPGSAAPVEQGAVGADAETAPDTTAIVPGLGDFASLQDIDWNSLIMDFDWTNNDLTYLPPPQ